MSEERPLCDCHGEPMLSGGIRASGTRRWKCRVKSRERWRVYFAERRADPEYRKRRCELVRQHRERIGIDEQRRRWRETARRHLAALTEAEYAQLLARNLERHRRRAEAADAARLASLTGGTLRG